MSALEPGSATWVTGVLEAEWGVTRAARLRPLTSEGEAPLTHTAGLWECRVDGRELVFKAQLNPDAARPADFYPLKQQLVARCRAAGVPAAEAVPTVRGTPVARHDGVVCELVPRYRGSSPYHATAREARAAVRAALRLRRTLDAVPAATARELARMPVNPLVDQPDPALALEEAGELLPTAERRSDPWGALAAAALRELLETSYLLDLLDLLDQPDPPDPPDPPSEAPAPATDSVIHADLHRHHFLLGPDGVSAVLDFDNARSGDRLLDLAWTAELCLSALSPGHRAGPELLREFVSICRAEGLLAEGEQRLLMPLLHAVAVPVIVDIAKDILVRDILTPAWARYFELLSPLRRTRVHSMLESFWKDQQ